MSDEQPDLITITFTREHVQISTGMVYTLICAVDQSNEQTAAYQRYGTMSPLDIVFEVLKGTQPGNERTISKTYDRIDQALEAEASIRQRCQAAKALLSAAQVSATQSYSGSDTFEL
jgi:hypothetical protein